MALQLRTQLAMAWRIAQRELRRATGAGPRADSQDRRLLERCILPHYGRRADVRVLLFVGTRWYTRDYPALLPTKRLLTIDIDPAAARYGSPGAHIVGDVCEIGRHVAPASLDVVVFNGVFGWGLDAPDDLQRALHGFARVLRPGGELVVGWNDVPRRRPFDWHALPALQAFDPLRFAPLGGLQRVDLPTDNRHCFEFFVRPSTRPPPDAG